MDDSYGNTEIGVDVMSGKYILKVILKNLILGVILATLVRCMG